MLQITKAPFSINVYLFLILFNNKKNTISRPIFFLFFLDDEKSFHNLLDLLVYEVCAVIRQFLIL